MFNRKLNRAFWDLNKKTWRRLPPHARNSRLAMAYGRWLHGVVCRRASRQMYLGTMFLRNRPALELMRRLAQGKANGSTFRVAVLGCSIGVEVYSIRWSLRSVRTDLEIVVHAVDVSPDVLRVAKEGVYGPEDSEMVGVLDLRVTHEIGNVDHV